MVERGFSFLFLYNIVFYKLYLCTRLFYIATSKTIYIKIGGYFWFFLFCASISSSKNDNMRKQDKVSPAHDT